MSGFLHRGAQAVHVKVRVLEACLHARERLAHKYGLVGQKKAAKAPVVRVVLHEACCHDCLSRTGCGLQEQKLFFAGKGSDGIHRLLLVGP